MAKPAKLDTTKRFATFLVLTMVGSAFFGGCVAGLKEAITNRDVYMVVFVPATALFGSLIMIPLYLAVFILPSALVFALALCMVGKERDRSYRIRVAGTLTALAASAVFWGVTRQMRDISELSTYVAIAAILIAPFTSWRAFRTQ